MAYDIGPRISITGEQDFNSQLKSINEELKVHGSELKEVASRYDQNSSSQEALISINKVLTKQLEDQQDKAQLLTSQLDKQKAALEDQRSTITKLTAEFGENSVEVKKAETQYKSIETNISKLTTSLNETKTYTNKLSSTIKTNNGYLDEMDTGLRDVETGLSNVADEAKSAAKDIEGVSDTIATAFTADAISNYANEVKSAITSIVEESTEYMQTMAKLDTAAEKNGYSAETTKEAYVSLYSVLADDTSSATALSNLQALGLSSGDLNTMIDGTIGAWALYGDSIPIDGLAEGINETVKAGVVTGTFADMLVWAGTSEDEFNEKLAACSSETERANLILQEMADQGLTENAEGYKEANENLINYNESVAENKDAMAELSDILLPIVTMIQDISTLLVEGFLALPEPLQNVVIGLVGIVTILGILAPAIFSINTLLSLFGVGATGAAVGATATGTASAGAAVGVTALNTSLFPIIAVIAAVIAIIAVLIAIFYNWDDILTWFKNSWSNFTAFTKEKWSDFTSFMDNSVSGLFDIFSSFPSKMLAFGEEMLSSFISGILRQIGIPEELIDGMTDDIMSVLKSIPSKAITWGKDMMIGLANGIKSGISTITSAVSSVASTITSWLHFTRPDTGPLREYEEWMPHFIEGMADGIKNNKSTLIDEIDSLTSDMNVNPSADIANSSINSTNQSTEITVVNVLDGQVITEKVIDNVTGDVVNDMMSRGVVLV